MALQILNHLQDCKDDYLALDRVYIPEQWLREEGTDVTALDSDAAGPELRRVLDRTLARTDELITHARAAPRRIRKNPSLARNWHRLLSRSGRRKSAARDR